MNVIRVSFLIPIRGPDPWLRSRHDIYFRTGPALATVAHNLSIVQPIVVNPGPGHVSLRGSFGDTWWVVVFGGSSAEGNTCN